MCGNINKCLNLFSGSLLCIYVDSDVMKLDIISDAF